MQHTRGYLVVNKQKTGIKWKQLYPNTMNETEHKRPTKFTPEDHRYEEWSGEELPVCSHDL